MDIKIDLDRSEYVKHRVSLLKSLQIPTLSEAKCNLGYPLAEILFDQCHSALKEDFGLTPLKGTGDELWVSPSDLLIGKVALKPPLTSKHIQALTHQGILTIGQEVEKKFWNETRMHEENYFDSRKRHLMDQCEEFFRSETKNIEQRERMSYMNQSQRLIDEFDEILLDELDYLEEKLRIEQEETLKKETKILNEEWERRFQDEINKTVKNMSEKLIDELDRQKNILASNFRLELQKAHVQRGYDINLEKSKCEESTKQLRHNLECKNIANMMYVLCLERRKCCHEKAQIEEHYVTEIKELKKALANQDQQIKTITEERDKQVMELNLRETCLLEIIRQFQKFINFALKAAPTQAEFLLSVEKMMAFELTNTILKSDYSRLKPCKDILPWQHQEKPEEYPKSAGLVMHDHHNCLKEKTEEGGEGADILPAFYYRDKLYVREDFRNMISQGIEITRSNELWSKDVEILIEILRKSVSQAQVKSEHGSLEEKPQTKKSEECHKAASISDHQSERDENFIFEKPRRVSLPGCSTIQFAVDDDVLGKSWSHANSRRSSDERRGSLKPVLNSLSNIDFSKIGTVEKKPALIAAANSLELIIKRGSVKYLRNSQINKMFDDDAEELSETPEVQNDCHIDQDEVRHSAESQASFRILKKGASAQESIYDKEQKASKLCTREGSHLRDNLAMETKDSIILRKTSLLKKSMEFNVSPKDSMDLRLESKYDMRRKPSKLVSAKNSLELLRESRMFSEPALSVTSSQKKEAKLKSSCSCSKQKCCDKCSQTKEGFDLSDETIQDAKRTKKESIDKSIKVSHIEIITVDNKDANVAINVTPTVYETRSSIYSTDLTNMYKCGGQKNNKKSKKKKVNPKDIFTRLPKIAKVVGDTEAKEHLQHTDEFTEYRIHSLVELIKDNPILLRTFTACTR